MAEEEAMNLHDQIRAAVDERKRIADETINGRTWGSTSPVLQALLRVGADHKRDLDVLERHAESDDFGPGWCFWCSEDGWLPITVSYPCPEIRTLAEEYGVEVGE